MVGASCEVHGQEGISMSADRVWLAFFAIWLFFLTGLFDFWFQTPGLKQWYRVQSSLSLRRQEIADVEARTASLRQITTQLETNPVAQEREIRRVLGYLGEKEVVFEF